jgi:hypothetical protein
VQAVTVGTGKDFLTNPECLVIDGVQARRGRRPGQMTDQLGRLADLGFQAAIGQVIGAE